MSIGIKNGFLLIEALGALAIFMIFSLLVARWQATMSSESYDLNKLLLAQNYAWLYAEKVRSGTVGPGYSSADGGFSIEISPLPIPHESPKKPQAKTGLKDFSLATVQVTWSDSRGTKQHMKLITGSS